MSLKNLIAIIIITSYIIFSVSCLKADESYRDKYVSKDKFEHFGISALITVGTGFIAYNHFKTNSDDAVIIGFSTSVSLGGLKEIIDSGLPDEHSSFKDLAADLLGALAGAALLSVIIR